MTAEVELPPSGADNGQILASNQHSVNQTSNQQQDVGNHLTNQHRDAESPPTIVTVRMVVDGKV